MRKNVPVYAGITHSIVRVSRTATARTGHSVIMVPNKIVCFFFSRLFDRRMFSSKDCLTGQYPRIGHDASHLYTSGSRMSIGEGQVQAGLRGRGLGVGCRGGGWCLERGSH